MLLAALLGAASATAGPSLSLHSQVTTGAGTAVVCGVPFTAALAYHRAVHGR
ncbi:hypothetical protein ABZ914_27695 [Spirillospora sp. NPDC046719]